MENWYKTIPLTTPSSSYLKRQYLKPQIKQAHLLIIIKPLPPYQNMSDINKLSPSPFPLPLPLWRLNWGIPQQLAVCKKYIQLFRQRLSEKVHATIAKGTVDGFEFSVLQRNLRQLARKAMEVCFRMLKESNKSRFDSYSRQEQCIDHIPYYLSGLSRSHFFRQPFSK